MNIGKILMKNVSLWQLFAALGFAWLAFHLWGCAGAPLADGTVPHYAGPHIYDTAPDGTVTDAWWVTALKLAGGVGGTSTLLSMLSANGRKAISTFGDPQAGVGASLQALGHVATFGYVPPPTARNVTEV